MEITRKKIIFYYIYRERSFLFQLFLSNLINIQFVCRREKPCFSTTNESFLVEFRCVSRREKYHSITH